MILTGTVRTGKGWASADMSPWRQLPFAPHPGTLNVDIGRENVRAFMTTVRETTHYKGRVYPYRMGTLNGLPVAVTNSGLEPNQVEVVCGSRLRDLPLVDGDTVHILLPPQDRYDYQPMWVDGETVGPFERDCIGRYEAIRPYVPQGARVLDFGSHYGYFSHRLADEVDARCLAVAPQAVIAKGVEVWNGLATVDDLRRFGKFDVVLALSILHHVRPWRDYYAALLDAAPTVIVEVPHADERFSHCSDSQIAEIATEVSGPVLCWTDGHLTNLQRPTRLAAGRLRRPGGNA
jgi:hypothetical protein